MTLWQAFKSTYGGSVAFIVACPLLAFVPVIFELLQHVAEVHIGMFDSIAAARAAEHDPARMAFGLLKIISLTVPIYWITRFLAYRDASFARAVSGPAIRLFGLVVLFDVVVSAIGLLTPWPNGWAQLAGLLLLQVIGCLVLAWKVAASLGNAAVGLRASITLMARQLPWTFAFMLVAVLPLMIPHYVLGSLPIVAPKPLLWPLLIADSLLVGWLAAVIVASGFFAASRAAGKAGVSLVPARTAPA